MLRNAETRHVSGYFRLEWVVATVFSSPKSPQPIPNDHVVYFVGLRPLACWDCVFESRRRNGSLSVAKVVLSARGV